MPITRKEVEEVALLSRLSLSDAETERLTRQLGDILGYIAKLSALDTSGVEGTTHAVPMDCPLREDRVGERLPAEEALRSAPRRVESFFEVPKIIDVSDDEGKR
jgi:aspartyl-tRNA(Asn)/glutamyl-tRNA(Gln) amidotransferase subunit C